jgi:hypothetical protein
MTIPGRPRQGIDAGYEIRAKRGAGSFGNNTPEAGEVNGVAEDVEALKALKG